MLFPATLFRRISHDSLNGYRYELYHGQYNIITLILFKKFRTNVDWSYKTILMYKYCALTKAALQISVQLFQNLYF